METRMFRTELRRLPQGESRFCGHTSGRNGGERAGRPCQAAHPVSAGDESIRRTWVGGGSSGDGHPLLVLIMWVEIDGV